MKLLQHLSLRTKLWLVPGVTGMMLVMVGGAAYLGLSRQDAVIREIVDVRQPRLLATHDLGEQMEVIQGSTYRVLAWAASGYSQATQQALADDVRRRLKVLDDSTVQFVQQSALSEAEREHAAPLQQQVASFVKVVATVLEVAEVDQLMGTTMMAKGEDTFKLMQSELEQLQQLHERGAREASDRAALAHRLAEAQVLAAAVIGLLLAAVATVLVQRAILGAVGVIHQAALQLRNGDLRDIAGVLGRDEVASSSQALAETVHHLRDAMVNVRSASTQIDHAIQEIAQGNADLSTRTEQQAAELQRTTGDMEALVGAVTGNTLSATQAAKLAEESVQAARDGGQVVQQVVAVMGQITTSASRIADITTVIDAIAFQTNILALNAAVEAARAGDAGLGFAVVAGEVRTLSQRCAQAAREIKTLITDSVERIDAGAALANRAGTSMQRIVGSAESLASTVDRISQASDQQRLSLNDISRTVASVDAATQQNAALVEQAAAAGAALHQESRRLVQAVGRFQLDGVAA